MKTATKALVFLPGSRWNNISGTDHQLALALAKSVPVLWVDPPLPFHHSLRGAERLKWPLELSEAAPRITRLRSLSLPGFTRRRLAPVSTRLLSAAVRATVDKLGLDPVATLVSSPIARFPAGLSGPNVLYVTDDWLAGAPMMGLAPVLVEKILSANLAAAHLVAAISPSLAAGLDLQQHAGQPATVVVPNGCDVPAAAPVGTIRTRTAALVGQLNERLDMGLLEALKDTGVSLLVIGPRTDRDPETRRRLDSFLAAGNVSWLGRLPLSETQKHLARAGVGLTPYRDNAFNRASFPLKTLDYLAAGLPVVATDLPAVRWLQTDLVTVGNGPEHFVRQVQRTLALEPDPHAEERRRAFAANHSWQARAAQLLVLIEGTGEHAKGDT